MAEMWKAQEKLVYENWILILETECWNELNEWERRFVKSLEMVVVTFKKNLTEAQAKKLEDIYTKYTNVGSKFGE